MTCNDISFSLILAHPHDCLTREPGLMQLLEQLRHLIEFKGLGLDLDALSPYQVNELLEVSLVAEERARDAEVAEDQGVEGDCAGGEGGGGERCVRWGVSSLLLTRDRVGRLTDDLHLAVHLGDVDG